MTEFHIGDCVWVADVGNRLVEKPCPICYGTREVTLILGNGDQVVLPCDYCGKGYDGPRGVVGEYEYVTGARPIIITSVETTETKDGISREYCSSGEGYVFKDVFPTYEEALSFSKEIKEAQEKEQNARAEHIKANVHKSFSWNAGYHLREAADHTKQSEYHRTQARLCKERMKEAI